MSATTTRTAPVTTPVLPAPEADTKARYAWAIARISLGWVFLWAFVDKTFGLGFATQSENAWLAGGSPTYGFLNFGTEGKIFHDFFAGLAGPTADWAFMLGLLGIGLALILGIGMRIAAVSGAVMMVLMWAAQLRLDNNPFMDDHIVYAIVLVGLALTGAGRTLGLGRVWERTAIVQRFPILK
jgi:thiosulfate dehydrogenase (quinone) large subunit